MTFPDAAAAALVYVESLGERCEIDGDDGHHLERVRRLRVGERVDAADGAGAWRRYEIIETRRGVGSFVNGTAARAHPPREHDRRLRAFATRMLAEADAAGFTAEDVIGALKEL